MPQKSELYRTLIDRFVDICRNGQGCIGPDRARKGVWNPYADENSPDQLAFNQLLSRMSAPDREVLALLLSQQVETGVFETLKILEEFQISPFENGYEGSPYADFIGRLTDWEWPKE